jgi:hypothetical protein
LISDAKAAAGAVIVKYVARASVAVPFLVAVGFAVAGITVMLVDRFGPQTAYWIMAGAFTAIGLVAALAVTVKEQEEETADAAAQAADTQNVAAEVALQAPLAALSGLLASPAGPTSALGIARLLGRNLPLVLLLVLAAFLLWPQQAAEGAQAGESPGGDEDAPEEAAPPVSKPNGFHTGEEVRT